MSHHSTVFAQLLNLIPRHEFEQLANAHQQGRRRRPGSRWAQCLMLMTAQLTGRTSLRDIVANVGAQTQKLYHLGVRVLPRSTFARINESQPSSLYEALFLKLLSRTRTVAPGHQFQFKNKLLSLDSTTIDLCLSVFPWAKYQYSKGANSTRPERLMNHSKQCALIVGVGDRNGIGGAVSTLLGKHGLHVFMVGRTAGKHDPLIAEIEAAGGTAETVTADCTSASDIEQVFAQVRACGMPLRFVLYNTGRNIPSPFVQSSQQLLDDHFKRGPFGGLLVGQGALRLMLDQETDEHGQRGSIFYTGASASMRGKPLFAGFSAAKAGLRAMAQSMAREFGPQGVHVGHVVIDGVIDGAIVQELASGVGKLLLNRKGVDGGLKPDEIAKQFWMLHQQPRSAWTQELDLRPYKETF